MDTLHGANHSLPLQSLPALRDGSSYDSAWADSLMTAILSHPEQSHQSSLQATLQASPSLPSPMPLDSSLRTQPSSMFPHIHLTHANGSLYGGPCPVPRHALRAYAQDLVELNSLGSRSELESFVREEMLRRAVELEARMRERKKAKEQNQRVENKIKILEEEREVDAKHIERWRSERERKRGR